MALTLQEQVEKSLKEKNPELLIIKLGDNDARSNIDTITNQKYHLKDFEWKENHMINVKDGIAVIDTEKSIEEFNLIQKSKVLIKESNNDTSNITVIFRKTESDINYSFRDDILGTLSLNNKTFNVHKGENNHPDPSVYYVVPKLDTPKVAFKKTKKPKA